MRIQFKLTPVGHTARYLVCDSLHSECGNVIDGLGFHFEDRDGTNRGCWVIDWSEFETFYKAAKTLREADL